MWKQDRPPRPSTKDRGYTGPYRRERDRIKTMVERGGVNCWRCSLPIPAGSDWHLGHDDHDRTIIRGAEHSHCNLRAAGRKGASITNSTRRGTSTLKW